MTADQTPSELATIKRAHAAARLPNFLDRGFVVSRLNGEAKHQGDSLLFSGLAMYALTREEGQPIADAMLKMLEDLDGGVYRHPDLKDAEPSLDGLLGLYRGIIKRINFYGEAATWAKYMVHHNSRVAASLPAEFNLVADTLAFKLGLREEPDMRRLHTLAVEVTEWARIVIGAKRACYRVHLGLLALQNMEEMGYPVRDDDRAAFAAVTQGAKLVTVDNYAGRPGLEDFLTNFAYNTWQFFPQRCPSWEKNDGDGMEHPAVDFLVGYSDLYGEPQ